MNKISMLFVMMFVSWKAIAVEPMIVEQNFSNLFNKFRYSQPTQTPWAGSYFPYGWNGIAVGVVDGYGRQDQEKQSASYFYDQMYNGGKNLVHSYEMKNHSCENVDPADKEGCQGWWGHCNGWSAAAIKEIEPHSTVQVRGYNLEVGHQKALLTELWLTSNSSFLGETQKRRATGNWIYDVNDPDYQTFWDVTPRQMVLAFMNQVGVMKTGLIIDRFTGDQVWNQPIVGYRILPIRAQDTGQQKFNGKDFFYANVRMKIYWANDNVHPGHISTGFNIDGTSDSESPDRLASDYDQRLLKFKLFFDAPVVMDSTGTQVQSAGRLVGDGLWAEQEDPSSRSYSVDQGHPDFLWLPQSAYIDTTQSYGNPYIGVDEVQEVALASRGGAVTPAPAPTPTPTPAPTPVPTPSVSATKFQVEVDRANIYDGDNTLIAERLIARIFTRASLSLDVEAKDIQFSGTHIVFQASSANGTTVDLIRQAFEDVDAKVIRINAIQ